MSEPLIDLRALLVERDEFEGSMVSKLREGLAQGGTQLRSLKEIADILTKKLESSPANAAKLHLKLGVAHFFLGHTGNAAEHFAKSEGPLASFFLGRAKAMSGDLDEALQAFDAAEKAGYAAQQVQLQRAGVLRAQGKLTEAKQTLSKLKEMATHNAEYHYQDGRVAEAEGDLVQASDSYERSTELDPTHANSMFRLAFLNDLAGNDEKAISLYEKCLKYPPIGKGLLNNLGVLYEDNGKFDRASECFRRIHDADPIDEQAKMFLRDADASVSETFSPEDEVMSVQFRQVMEIPITDFELSVRSRNCLKRMNLRTLGDLTRVSEAQLLASKNFGETSLEEIKEILESKGLRVGQSLEQGQQYELRFRPQPNLTPEEQAMMAKPVSELNLTVRARKCMNRLNINTLGELCSRTSDELLEAKNFGVTSLNEVKEKLTEMGLKLRGD